MIDNPVPRSLKAEAAVLGAIMIDPQAIVRVAQLLKPHDFYEARHETIFAALTSLHDEHMPIDLISVTARLEKRDKLQRVGGAAYLTSLANHVPSAFHVEAYAREVEDASIRRQVLQASMKAVKAAFDTSKSLDEILDIAETQVYSVRQQIYTENTVPASVAASELWDELEKAHAAGAPIAFKTGYKALDEYYRLRNSEVTIVAARPGMGKSALCLNLAQCAAKASKTSLIFSLEMTRRQIVGRIAASRGHITTQQIKNGEIPDELWGQVATDIEEAAALPIHINTTPGMSIGELRAETLRFVQKHGKPDVVFIDYIQLMESQNRREKRYLEVGQISRGIKRLCLELDRPFVVASQLNRLAAGQVPQLHHLRESGDLEQDADNVIFIHYDSEASGDVNAQIIIAKQREGKKSVVVYLKWAPERVSFLPMPYPVVSPGDW